MEKITQLENKLILFVFFVLLGANGFSQSEQFNASGNFVVPAGVTSVTVEAWGAGGHGGSRTSSGRSGGGGGGAYARSTVSVTPGQVIPVTVGQGSTNNNPGGDSWFLNASTVMAKGGESAPNNGSTGGNGGSAANSVGTLKNAGGNGYGTTATIAGGGGSSASAAGQGNHATNQNGANAPTGGGKGGNGRSSGGSGSAGTVPGGGGGGSYRTSSSGNTNGGNGANGRVVVSYVIQDINLVGNGNTIANNDTTPSLADHTDFGYVLEAGSTSLTRTFTLQNLGSGALGSISASIIGANASDFTIVSAVPSTLAAGSSTSLQVTFNPSGLGDREAILRIVSNDPDENPYQVSLKGYGSVPVTMTVLGNSIAIPDNNTTVSTADNTDFGLTDTATGTIVKTFTVTNAQYAPTLTITGVTISGTGSGDFSVSPTSASIAGGASQNFTVTFNPSGTTERNVSISFANNDTSKNPYNFSLRGTGADSEIRVLGNGISIADGATTPNTSNGTSFGSVEIYGNATISRTFTIENISGANWPLTVTGISTNNSQFTITSMPSGPIAVGDSATFTVTFDPTSTGTKSAMVTINSNDFSNSSYAFAVSGVGTDPEIDVRGNNNSISDGDSTPSTNDWTDFGSTSVSGGTLIRTFTITNAGSATATLNLGTITVQGSAASDFTVNQPALTSIAPGQNTTFSVVFDPSASGTRNAEIVIPNNDNNESPYNFAIRGTGNDPEINVTGNGISIPDENTVTSLLDNTDLGSVSMQGGTAVVTYTIQNTGVGALSIDGISISEGISTETNFTIAAYPASSVAQGGSTTFQISFTPTTVGQKNATVYIINDDGNENPYNFRITGLGVMTYPDTDGDGISDNIDIDDDNDGIIDTMEQSFCSASSLSSMSEHVFLNETFGAGTTKGQININIPGATCTYCYEDGIVQPNTTQCPSQSSWILDDGEYVVTHRIANYTYGHPDNIHYDLAWNGYEDHTPNDTYGRMAVFNASYAPGVFYETTISGIMPNVPITYSFWALNIMSKSHYNGTILPNITVEFRDLSNNLISSYNTGDLGRCQGGTGNNSCEYSEWIQFTTSVNLGNVTSFIIRFRNNAPGGGGNDLALDDIMIKQQYCDRDSDGIANIFDLDSDNDGIPDIEEAGFGYLSGGKGRMDLETPGVWIDNNGNGLHDAIDAMIAGGTYLLPDTDSDTVPNFQDLDSDNDSLFDVDEAGLANGDGDIDGDGVGDGLDTDGDGILDIFDTLTGFGTNPRPFAQNSDGLGNPDYMQLDSNNDGITDIKTGLYASLDANNDGRIDGSADADRDGIIDTFDTNTAALGSPRNLERKLYIDFDGRNDYAEGTQLLGSLPQATIMAWIKIPSGYASDGILFGQDNFLMRIPTNGQLRATAKGVTVSSGSSNVIQPNRWYHVAATYDGTQSSQHLKLWINGQQVAQSAAGSNGTLSGALAASSAKFTIGKNSLSSANYFNGSIEEVRVFNTALSADQLQKMVYQEIKQNAAAIRGEFIPKDIEGTSWSSLLAYYRMDNFKGNVIDNHTTAAIDAGNATNLTRIYNVKNIKPQLAPMPFVTTQSSSIETAVSQNNFVNGPDVVTIPWSIVHIKHNIDFNQNQTNLGMVINPGVTVNLTNNNKLENSWYLKLDGKLDLQGKSQLVQTQYSDLDPTSSGFIEKDQLGTTNLFNYNYWCSPVGAINSSTNNNNYTVSGVMKDGTDPANPVNLNWTSGYNSAPTSPITISSAWIYKFQNMSNIHANWSFVGQNGALSAGQGYTMKGSSAPTESQNYTFVGKPNNGTISIPVAANNLNLTGNPYASAIDADQFILDNLSVIDGAIYFWEHFGTNSSHISANYQGGYGTYTLVGGTPPVTHPELSGLGSSNKAPKRYIPVAQGFMVFGNATGGNITFRNAQRAFVKEDNALSTTIFKQAASPLELVNNADDPYPATPEFSKIRLGYDYANGLHRQLLLGFMNDLATSGFDPGFDADNSDSNPDDLMFKIGTHKCVIQGDGYFNVWNSYPLEAKAAATGNVKFKLDGTENFDPEQPIYIFDSLTGVYHDIRQEPYTVNLPAGTHAERFFLRFVQGEAMSAALKLDDQKLAQGIAVAYEENVSVLNVRNQMEDVTVTKATLMNMLGQTIGTYDVEGQEQLHIRIPLKSVSAGTYVVKIETTGGVMSQKVVIK